MSGFGAALADSVYGLIAGFGLTALSSFLLAQQFWIRLIGGLFLLYLESNFFWQIHKSEQLEMKSDLFGMPLLPPFYWP